MTQSRLKPHSLFFTALFGLGGCLLWPALVAAQDSSTITDDIDKIFSWATPMTPGCVVGVSHHGKPVVNRAYGVADVEQKVPLRLDTVFDVGSVVKQFVAAATLLLIQEGRLSLSEDVRKYIPELPDYGHRITLDHLLTHTSGVRDWTGLGPLTGRQVDALTVTLRQRGLNFSPGAEWSYSNGGYVLLKEIVARASGMAFGDFTHKRLFEPLGMKSTAYLGDGRELKNLALAYERTREGWKPDMLVGNARGGGGALFSTAGDLLIWNDALTTGRLGAFVSDKLQEPATLGNGRTLGYGRGLFLDANRGGKVLWHSGGSAGYSSMVARFPEQRLSIAMVCNAGEVAETTAFSRQIFDVLVPGVRGSESASSPPSGSAGATAGPIDLEGKAGLYFNERTGQPLRLVLEKGRLRVQGGPPLEVVSSNSFRNPRGVLSFMSQDQFEMRFGSPNGFELKSLEGAITRYRRAESYAPTAAELQVFAGSYQNDENRVVMQIGPGKDALMVRLSNVPTPGFEFRPVDRDTFQFGGMLVRFRRDKAGSILGLDYSNPVVRNIEFVRVKD
jgi:CubicO group peptidase (beta-lactamase class C family)